MPVVRMAIALAAVVSVSPVSFGRAQGALQPGPYEAQLEALLKAHDTMAVGRAIFPANATAETTARAAAWLKTQQTSKGGGTLMNFVPLDAVTASTSKTPAPSAAPATQKPANDPPRPLDANPNRLPQ